MSYAINSTNTGWRSINSIDDLLDGEVISESQPELVPPPPTPQDLLNKLDADYAMTQRAHRETLLLMAEAIKQVSGGALDLNQVRRVQMVAAVEAQAAVLRGQIQP